MIPQFQKGVKGDFVAFFPMAVVFRDKKARRNNMIKDEEGDFAQKHPSDSDPALLAH